MIHQPSDITAIILAGGPGKRLNRGNKGLVTLAGKTLLAHAIERLEPQTPNIVISANQNLADYRKIGYPVVKDKFQDYQGPLAGVLSCRSQIKTPLVLTLPCDVPLLPTDLLATLLQSYTENNATRLCVAHDGNRQQNLFMLFSIKALSGLSTFFEQKKRKVGDWIQSQPHTQVDFSTQRSLFTNINTEKTLTQLQKMIDGHE